VETLRPIVIQLGTTCLQMALTRLWSSFGIKPNFVLGHSLGEYAALHAAEVLSARDTIYLCGSRARLLQERCEAGTHAMIAVKGSFNDLGPYLVNDKLEIACSNGPQETVLAGLRSDVDILYQRLSTAGFKSTKLNVPFAFHTAQVEPILESFKEVAVGVTFHAPTIPIISAVTGNMIEALDTSIIGPDYLVRHCRDTVNFMQGIHAAREAKLFNDKSMWIEIGPHSVCSGMVKSSLHAQVATLSSLRRNDDGWKVLVSSLSSLYLAGHDINWGEYHRDFTAGHEVLQLPAYSWDNKNYWIQYEHNWTLTKGDPPTTVPEVAKVSSSFSTISVQKILEEREEGTSATVLMESDFQHPLLKAVASGHRVNGAQLCPSVSDMWFHCYCLLSTNSILVTLCRYCPDSRELLT
jgi:naphtho-gamma-pyrone polyketide synthase